ncbi:hypothetical protein D3C81_1869120 [compost metagenome]
MMKQFLVMPVILSLFTFCSGQEQKFKKDNSNSREVITYHDNGEIRLKEKLDKNGKVTGE